MFIISHCAHCNLCRESCERRVETVKVLFGEHAPDSELLVEKRRWLDEADEKLLRQQEALPQLLGPLQEKEALLQPGNLLAVQRALSQAKPGSWPPKPSENGLQPPPGSPAADVRKANPRDARRAKTELTHDTSALRLLVWGQKEPPRTPGRGLLPFCELPAPCLPPPHPCLPAEPCLA